MLNKTEILAPAGNTEAVKAAVNAYADAVYLGGSMFSARAFAGNFDEKELALVNVLKKPLPFKKKFESTICTDDYQTILKAIFNTEKKSIVIDDAGYLITNHFMNKHSATGGGNGVFNLYNEINLFGCKENRSIVQ